MAGKTQSGPPEVLFLPVEIVKASPGFSFDVGSSLKKVIYRSKEDFSNGEPITEQAVVDGKARVCLTTLSRDLGPAALVQLVKEKVDLDLSGSHRTRISSTGTGSNFWQPEIESQLNIELDIGMEDVYFSEGFQFLAENLAGEEFAYPPSQAGLEAARDHKELIKNWHAASGKVSVDEFSKLTNLQHRLPEGAKPFLPSLLVMCGSNFLFIMMRENGELVTVDGITLGGKALSAFGSYILGTQSFSEMMQAIEQAGGYSCDVWVKETVNLDSSGNYGNMASTKRVLFPLAKLQDPKQAANVKKEDIVRSMFRTAIEGLAQMAYLNALAFGVRRIYFLGSFINIPLARKLITTELEGRILLRPKDQQVEYSFVRHGGYC